MDQPAYMEIPAEKLNKLPKYARQRILWLEMMLKEVTEQAETLRAEWSSPSLSRHGIEIGIDKQYTVDKWARLVIKSEDERRKLYFHTANRDDNFDAELYTTGNRLIISPSAANRVLVKTGGW